MDNISKVLVIAGGFLVGILIVSVCMYLYSSFKVAYENNLELHDTLEIEAFNNFFYNFSSKLDGWEAYNIVGKIADINTSEDSLTNISLSGDINQNNYKETTFYFTEALEAENVYDYTYKDTDGDGIIDWVKIKK